MSRTDLIETITPSTASLLITEGKTDGPLKMRGIAIQGDVRNHNGRIYPINEIERAITSMKNKIEGEGPIAGECDHPDNMQVALDRVTHLIDRVWLEGANGMAEMRLIPTHLGQSLIALARAGARLGVSSRGTGEVDNDGVVSNFEILTVDMVATPSAPDAYPKPVLEALQSTKRGREVLKMSELLQQDNKAQKFFVEGIKEFIKHELQPKRVK